MARLEEFEVSTYPVRLCADRSDVVTQIFCGLTKVYQSSMKTIGVCPQLFSVYRDFRAGDVRHSLADVSKAATLLGYNPTHRIGEGLKVAMDWYISFVSQQAA